VAFLLEKAVSKEEMTQLVKDCAAKLGHIPTLQELQAIAGLNKHQIRKTLGLYKEFVRTCGLEGRGIGHQVPMRTLFDDWAGVVRRLGKIPSVCDYQAHGRYSYSPMRVRYGTWRDVPGAMLAYAREEGIEAEWKDVADVILSHLEKTPRRNVTASMTPGVTEGVTVRHRVITGQPIYGRPILPFPLTYAPTDESGVIFLFGTQAERLGFAVQRIQRGFPDCEALREISPNQCQKVRIEFELESRNFLQHLHPIEGCDLIICWKHNWPQCPLEVLELQKVIVPQQPKIEYAATEGYLGADDKEDGDKK
jgi:hypothetical protein